jgi:hypothetical protein
LLVLAAHQTAAAEPRHILLLHSFGPHFSPWRAIAGQFRHELIQQSRSSVDLYEASLQSGRFGQPQDEAPFIDYLRALFAGRGLDLVVAMGAPAARFFLQHRPQLFPTTPLLITGADERALSDLSLTSNDTAVGVWFDQAKQIENVLQLLPDTTNIAVATGASPIEQFWLANLRRAYEPFTDRVKFEWLNDSSFEDTLKRVARLPRTLLSTTIISTWMLVACRTRAIARSSISIRSRTPPFSASWIAILALESLAVP